MKPKAYEDMTHEEQHQHLVLAHGVDGMDFSLWTVEEHQTDHDDTSATSTPMKVIDMPQRTTSNSRVTRPRNDSERRTNAATSQTRSSFYSVQIRIVLGGETMTLTICATCCALKKLAPSKDMGRCSP
jgi:hypothetical protein